MTDIRVKRAYRAARISDGQRILVDRIWPRGMTRERLRIAEWAKDIAPSPNLRRWFGHDPGKWDGFRTAYFRELDGKKPETKRILESLRNGPVTLVYGAKNDEMNNAVALKEYLERQLSACSASAADVEDNQAVRMSDQETSRNFEGGKDRGWQHAKLA
ncbi:DUF488 domain-containing protein [Oricola nitratireducens]|uniref:DUF488 domain-containing protein n=1 Tax=Oricola nitratireducens TaxID=2775868 RepID=UPI001865F5EE|nr:DUF488 family protein [Oricola nitratireducens]